MNQLSQQLAEKAAALPARQESKSPEQVREHNRNAALHGVKELLERLSPEIAKALPRHLTAERLARMAYTQVRKSPELALCTPESLMGAVLTCAQLGLEPGPTGEVWFIPRKTHRRGATVWEATFQLGYQGMVTLFWRHPLAAYLATGTVREGDEFDYQLGLEPNLVHRPARVKRGEAKGEPVGYWYAVARLTNGGFAFRVLDWEDVEARRNASSSANSPAWRQHYNAMAEKSCIRALFDLLPKSTEIQRALAWDGQVRTQLDADAIEEPPKSEVVDGDVEWPDVAVPGPSDSDSES